MSPFYRTVNRFKKFLRPFSGEGKAEVTALYDFHVENGGKIVNFGGFLLPVQYSDLSIVNSHLFTRKSASLFDVSHMLQTEIYGKGCVEFIESTCTADVKALKPNSAALTIFTNTQGGILDDLIVTKVSDEHLYVVSNAARKQHDKQLLKAALSKFESTNSSCKVELRFFEPTERSLLALQGPKAAHALQKLTNTNLGELYFMTSTVGDVAGVTDCRITRCGYTGEDGFEISIPSAHAVKVAVELLKNDAVKLAGLGARDSLRLEAGLCLYGNDIDETTTPVEAALTWLVAKKRRANRDFPGANPVCDQIKTGATKKRIGLISENGPPARQGVEIVSKEGEVLGKVTSGCPSPSLKKNIAMGYVNASHSKVNTEVSLRIRGKTYEAVVSKMPFVNSNYYNKPK